MKKIGLSTCYIHNYGACLQAFALQQTLKSLKFESEIIPFVPKINQVNESFIKRKINTLLRYGLSNIIKSIIIRSNTKKNIERGKYFDDFINKHLIFNDKIDPHIDLKKQIENEYDAYICGSDQIWNPLIFGGKNQPEYFLDYAPEGKKRIAYVPSIGINKLPDSYKEEMKQLLLKITHISVREYEGAKIIKELTGRDAQVLLDPTLLLCEREWIDFAGSYKIDEPYILCYLFGDLPYINKFVQYIKKETGYKVVTLPYHPREMIGDKYKIWNAGPLDFVSLINNAALVCTDSFHATAFSINLKTPFYSLTRFNSDDRESQNSRIYTILNKVNLKSRIITPDQNFPLKKDFFNIDFLETEKILSDEREKSINFLSSSINN